MSRLSSQGGGGASKEVVEIPQLKEEGGGAASSMEQLLCEFSLEPEKLKAPLALLGVKRVEVSQPLPKGVDSRANRDTRRRRPYPPNPTGVFQFSV
jgi:hypothetical protein